MRLCSFSEPDGPLPGLVVGDEVVPLATASTLGIITGTDPIAAGEAIPLADLMLEAPVIPGAAIAIGLNYRAHASETGRESPAEPVLFAKMGGTDNRPSGPVVHPKWTRRLDYEGELGVVIGRRAHRVLAADALGHVSGYMAVNDVSARDREKSEPQWIRAKSGWGFMPMGPGITSSGEVGDPQTLRIRTWVNDELRRDTNTGDMIFPVAELVASASQVFPLEPGDVIITGTPSGEGVGMNPMRFLQPGDVVRIEIDRLGTIKHAIVTP